MSAFRYNELAAALKISRGTQPEPRQDLRPSAATAGHTKVHVEKVSETRRKVRALVTEAEPLRARELIGEAKEEDLRHLQAQGETTQQVLTIHESLPSYASLANVYESLRLLMTAWIRVVYTETTEKKMRATLLSESEDFTIALTKEAEENPEITLSQLAEKLRLLWWETLPMWKQRADTTFNAELLHMQQAHAMRMPQAMPSQPTGYARGHGRGQGVGTASRDRSDEGAPYGYAQHGAAHRSPDAGCKDWSGYAGSCQRKDCHFRKSHVLGIATPLYQQLHPGAPRGGTQETLRETGLPQPPVLAITRR